MAPPRKAVVSDPSSSKSSSSTPHKKSKRPQHKKHPAPPPPSSSALPGVQKIKAALRQTRRLLAKDKLAADVRVATERRLKSLEADLAKAERARVERTLATRYHKIKFFERQKVARRLRQTQRKLADADGKTERRELEARQSELRVDLNYILHYPKTKKYISLFPPEVRHGEGTVQGKVGKVREVEDAEEKPETHRQREEVRAWIREQMAAGALSSEPEVELEKAERKIARSTPVMGAKEESKGTKGNRREVAEKKPAKKGGVAGDDFFGADDGEDDSGDEESTQESSEDDGDSGGGESDGDVDMDED
ncbi:hypothetical protein C8Q78DRAFT_185091 [Trametes maxima]|nr:hypothetical protein C8Q78DRAFT_185091 [Trametes maxima]